MEVARDMVFVGRVLHEDDDFLTLEVGKRDAVQYTLEPAEGDEPPKEPERFFTVMFIKFENSNAVIWSPFEGGDDGTIKVRRASDGE